ncbi:hypothetical protein EJ08DRAFT_22938 [Tothia fuscella]|uniref:DUF7730 domain-containing protein n=1 Tax=Tothia fuscella TaxID=1048955 RepID=A0A9P4NZ98_9PEZI|nr:hypothetical protein EJ08DRAFT_22938 [Tothia fuscella]
MSTTRSDKAQLLSSWPRPIARLTPIWLPYRVLRLADSIGQSIIMALIGVFLVSLSLFGNRDMWGARRDRAKERQWDREWKQHRAEEAYWKPTPLPLPRKRRLSLPLDPPVKSKWWKCRKPKPERVFDQRQSPLGRLPEELRQLIYVYVIGAQRIHIQHSFKRLGYVVCIHNESGACHQALDCLKPHLNLNKRIGDQKPPSPGGRLILSHYNHLKLKPNEVEANNTEVPKRQLLAMAKTCRLFYTGYLAALYSIPDFSFTSVKQFELFSTAITSQRLEAITSLEFHSELRSNYFNNFDTGWEEIPTSHWKKGWEIIAKMGKLKHIFVDLRMDPISLVPETSSSGVHRWMEERIFDPMRGVTHVNDFVVEVNWYQSRNFELGETPFTLTRQEDRLAWSVDRE